MISFACTACNRMFTVPDSAQGRKAKCRCGAQVIVPARGAAKVAATTPEAATAKSPRPTRPSTPIQTAAPGAKSRPEAPAKPPAIPMRTRRLLADAQQMTKAFAKSAVIRIHSMTGQPPEEYVVDYFLDSLERGKNGKPAPRKSHRVQIHLTSDYPRLGPQCKMLTPIFHPNIDAATICVGDHWAAGERLADLVVRIGEMLAYQAYNIKSPLDGEAAMWADLNASQLPTDHRNLRPRELE